MFKVTQLINIKNVILSLNAILSPVILIRKNGHTSINLGGENAKHEENKKSISVMLCVAQDQ